MLSRNASVEDEQNEAFQNWLIETCTSKEISQDERNRLLSHWEDAPYARYCHPREEHLLPLHVCCAIAASPAKTVLNSDILGKKACAFLW